MKTTIKVFFAFSILAVLATGCEDLQSVTPTSSFPASGLNANFTFANATLNGDAYQANDTLSLKLNGTQIGAPVGPYWGAQPGYTNFPIASNGTFANTAMQVSAVSGAIGGALGGANVVYRSSSTTATGDFTAANGGYYTVFLVDSVNRPKPLRTLNSDHFGDTTFFNTATGLYISRDDRAALTATQKGKLVPIGTVPLGSSDPGGYRYYIVQDVFPAFLANNVTQSAIRFVNLSANSYPVGTGVNAHSYPTADQRIYAKLVGPNNTISLGTSSTYPFAFPGFNPTVGSRFISSTTSTHTLQTTAVAGTPDTYTLNIATNSGYTTNLVTIPGLTFEPNKIYTIYVRGKVGVTSGAKQLTAKIITLN